MLTKVPLTKVPETAPDLRKHMTTGVLTKVPPRGTYVNKRGVSSTHLAEVSYAYLGPQVTGDIRQHICQRRSICNAGAVCGAGLSRLAVCLRSGVPCAVLDLHC